MAATAKQQQQTGVRSTSTSSTASSPTTRINSSTKNLSSPTGILSTKSSSPSKQKQNFIETEEDIATIAKQISDHAEAIYQTWKARGLAPTEILNCHTGTSDAFGKALTPQSTNRNSFDTPVVDILSQAPDMSNNNLEKLVSSFVNEDKARQQAAKKHSTSSNILTSGTIKDALKKFESNSIPANYVKPNFLIKNTAASKAIYTKHVNNQDSIDGTRNSIVVTSVSTTSSTSTSSSTSPSSSSSSSNSIKQLNKNVPDVLMDTINQTKQLPKDFVTTGSSLTASSGSSTSSNNISRSSISNSSIKKPQTPAKPANLLNHTPSWPLKNRLSIGNSIGNAVIGSGTSSTNRIIESKEHNQHHQHQHQHQHQHHQQQHHHDELNSKKVMKKSLNLLDEVSREEERLINALRTGVVLNSNEKLPEVITSTLSDKVDRTSNWIKPDVSTTSSKSSSTTLQSQSPPTTISTILSTKKLLPSIAVPSKLSSNLLSQSSSSPVGAINTPIIATTSATWSDDSKKVTATIISSSMSVTTGTTTTTTTATSSSSAATATATTTPNTTATVINSINQNIQKTDNMSPVPAPSKIIKLRPKNDAAVPHPETKNSNSHNNHVNSRINAINPVRPFLTRGSVAERVLMFEKCPDVKAPLRNINRESSKITTKPLIRPEQQTHTTLQRHIRSSSKNVYIPRFHFPHGKPLPTITVETTLQRLVSAFDSFPNNQVTKDELPHILKICGLPFYWRIPLLACTQHATSGLVDGYRFIEFWKQMSVYCHDAASRFVYILSRGQRSRPYILHEDLAPLVQDVVDTHPGLAFLKEATEFHSRYVHTVIARIFYTVNRSWSGKITVPELRRSNLLQVIQLLEEEEDINQIMAFFSYEHFYVIYCKFWELDRDHDLFIDQNDLARHNDNALSTRIIERIFSGCVTRGSRARISGPNGPKMSYTDFVWFLLSEEDKTNPTAIEYWFRCMDLDGDGVLSMYELEYFYEEQQQRMEAIGIETLPFEDCLCQMLDMVKPIRPGCITLGDLKRCRMTPIFFDTFFNLEKYLEHEQRDPFATQRDNDDMSDWDRYAAQEYELLVAEEGGDTQGSYDEDDEYEPNIDILESQLDDMPNVINEW